MLSQYQVTYKNRRWTHTHEGIRLRYIDKLFDSPITRVFWFEHVIYLILVEKWTRGDLNPRPPGCEPGIHTPELLARLNIKPRAGIKRYS